MFIMKKNNSSFIRKKNEENTENAKYVDLIE